MAVEVISLFPQSTGPAAIADLDRVFDMQRAAFAAEPYPDYATRVDRLKRLDRALREHETAIQDAISADFGNRAREETLLFEQFMSHEAVRHTLRHLRDWMKPERRKVPYWSKPGRARVLRQPLGLVGVIVPWNYPLMLAISPAIAALAAGNRVMIKMSEFTPRLGALLAELVSKAFREDELHVLNGEVDVATAFASKPFDHMLFTGSTRIGKEIMRLASQNLTPVTLELGGKSPAIVHEGLGIEESARRIIYGKCANAGQTCVAPDYALVPEDSVATFIAACKAAVQAYYPTLAGNPQFTTVAQDRQYQRLQRYIDDARAKGATLHRLHDEPDDPVRRVMVPAALTGVSDDMIIMQEEIFGPLMPVVPYRTLDEAIQYINHRPRPLALYYFGTDKKAEDEVMKRTVSGGVTINNCMFHVAMEDLPFGGVGPSGMGHYHGSEGFETFTKHKAVYIDGKLSGSTMLRPPYGKMFRTVMGFIHR